MPAKSEYPNAWVPTKEGETITGELVEVVSAYSDQRAKNGSGYYPLLRLKLENGDIKDVHCFQTVSYNLIRDKRPVPGEVITFTYRGEGTAKNGNNAPHLFTLDIAGRDPVKAAENSYANLFGDVKPTADPAPESDIPWDDEPEVA